MLLGMEAADARDQKKAADGKDKRNSVHPLSTTDGLHTYLD